MNATIKHRCLFLGATAAIVVSTLLTAQMLTAQTIGEQSKV
ncbi:MAG: hypothetical protein ACI814_004389, partial [Mariniblastus sp.]